MHSNLRTCFTHVASIGVLNSWVILSFWFTLHCKWKGTKHDINHHCADCREIIKLIYFSKTQSYSTVDNFHGTVCLFELYKRKKKVFWNFQTFFMSEKFHIRQEHITGKMSQTQLTALSHLDKHVNFLKSKALLFFVKQSGNWGNLIPWESNLS